jgi:hypothetical protein
MATAVIVLAATVLITSSDTGRRKIGSPREPGSVQPAESSGTSGPTDQATVAGQGPAAGRKARGTSGALSGTSSGATGAITTSLKVGAVIRYGNPGAAFGQKIDRDAERQRRHLQAMTDEINATGGFGGRKVTLVVREVDHTNEDKENQTRLQNQVCTQLTEDDKVDVVYSWGAQFYAHKCYADHKTPALDYFYGEDEQIHIEDGPWWLPPLALNLTPTARLLPVVLDERGFLTQRMGLVSFDPPVLKRPAEQVLIPGVEARGGKIIDQYWIPITYEDIATGYTNAVVRFKQQSIDRVIVWGFGSINVGLFAHQAESQNYRPRYAVNSYQLLREVITRWQTPPQQLRGAVGFGFWPVLDLTDNALPPPSEKEKACWEVLNRRAGESFMGRSDAAHLALGNCEPFWFTQTALAPAKGEPLSRGAIPGYFESLGTRYVPVQFPKSLFVKGGLDGIATYAHVGFDDGCQCWKYLTPWLDIPASARG